MNLFKVIQEHFGDRLSLYLLIVILSGLAFFYYFVYVPQNEQKLNEHALRLMENKAQGIKGKYAAYQTAINSAPVSYFAYWHFSIHEDADKVFFVKKNGAYHYASEENLLKSFKPNKVEFITREEYWHVRYDNKLKPQVKGTETEGAERNIWKVKNGDFYFVYHTDPDFYQYRLNEKTKKTESEISHQYFWLRIKDFSSTLKTDDFFEDVLLLRDTVDKGSAEKNSLEISAFDSQVLDESNLGLVRMSLPANAGKYGSGIYEDTILGKTYKIYYKLVRLKRGLNVYAVGLIPTGVFQKHARQIPLWFLLFCALGALLLILISPALKIFFLNEHERLSAIDARLSTFSLVVCTGLITVVLLGSYIFWVPESKNHDQTLLKLADTIQQKAVREVALLRQALQDKNLFAGTDEKENTKNFIKNYGGLSFNEALSITKQGYIKKIFFNDITKKNNVDKFQVRLSDRSYFKNIKAAQDYSHEMDYTIEAINSLTSGKSEAAIGISYVDPNGSIMRVITSSLPSLINTNIPSPYKFVVVDRNGDIKFHSDWKEVRFENFVSECDDDRTLRAYFGNQIVGYKDFNYLRNDCRGYIKPLLKGWSVIVYYELENTRSLAAQVFSLCLVTLALITFYILILQLILSADNLKPVLLKTNAFFFDWLNPNNNKPVTWFFLFSINLALFVVEIIWLIVDQSTVLTILFLLTLVSISYYLSYRKLNRYRQHYRPERVSGRMVAFIVFWLSIFILANITYGQLNNTLILIPVLVIIFLSLKGDNSLKSGELTDEALPRWLREKHRAYHAFLFSSILSFSVGPSILFVCTHYQNQNFIRNYAYLLEDVKRIQIKTPTEQEKNRGIDYTDQPSPQEKFSKINSNNLDYYFYRNVPSYTTNQVSVDGLRFNYVPDYANNSILRSSRHLMIQAPSSYLSDNPASLVRTRLISIPFLIIDSVSLIIVIVIILALWFFLWALKGTARRIFFMPQHNLWNKYPQRNLLLNTIQREFENDDSEIHPLYNFNGKQKIINQFEALPTHLSSHEKSVQLEKILLDLQTEADSLYESKWNQLSDKEKFFLYDLADDGVTNQSDTSLIDKLSSEGYIRLEPALEIVNTSFANYVKMKMPPEKILEWRKKENRQGRWKNMRIAIIIIIIAACGFLSVAEEEFLGRISALLASISLIVPSIIGAIGHITKLFRN